jgi:predicted dehydrogenase
MRSESELRVGVIGAGFFGQHHARHYASLPGVRLVAVVDRNEESANRLAGELGCAALADFRELFGRVDAVSVVVPTVAHYSVAKEFLARGTATLVEKPLALSVDEARAMVRLAQRHRAVLQVGHVERFNPVWRTIEDAAVRPSFVECQRFSPFPFRSLDVSVVFDVMIHDLDLVLASVGSTVASLEAVGGPVIGPLTDRAEVHLRFANGCRAALSANRSHFETRRTMRLWNRETNVHLDFYRRTSVVHARRGEVPPFTQNGPLTLEERDRLLQATFSTATAEFDKTIQPLRLELEDFVRCAQTRAAPKVDGEAGYEAVALAERIQQSINSGAMLRNVA